MSPRPRILVIVTALVIAVTACSSADSEATSTTTDPTTVVSSEAPSGPTGDLDSCPEPYREGDLAAGTHGGFASAGQERSFHLLLPDSTGDAPAPLFVALTGTVQEERSFLEQSKLDQLPDSGWIVVAPVRNQNGKIWGPWDAMRTELMTGPNPDEEFVMDLVACVSAHHTVDSDRVFVGGISVGGTFTTYLLRRHSDVFAGGIVGSGNFMLTAPPKQEPLEPMTVIVAWGGDGDQWTGCPDGRMGEQYRGEPGCAHVDFVPEAHATVNFFKENSSVIACTEPVGHIWLSNGTEYFADILAKRPKGSSPDGFSIGDPPKGITCQT